MKNKFKITTLTLGIFSAIFLTYLMVSAWTEPTQSPPSGNVSIDIDCIERSELIDDWPSTISYKSFYSPSCPPGYTWVSGGYRKNKRGGYVTRLLKDSTNNRTHCRIYTDIGMHWLECKAYCCRID